jgi:serine protease
MQTNTGINLSTFTPPFNDDTPLNATRLGTIDGTQIYRNSVSALDPADYYQFRTGTGADGDRINLSLSDLTADADIILLDDAGGYVSSSANSGRGDESISLSGLQRGQTYFVKVVGLQQKSQYTLNVSNRRVSNLVASETDLGILKTAQSPSEIISFQRSGYLSNQNATDIYRFNLDTASVLTFDLKGKTEDSTIRLIDDRNGNGIVDAGEELARSESLGTTRRSLIQRPLGIGRYWVQVSQSQGDTAYSLTITSLPLGNNPVPVRPTLGTQFNRFTVTDASEDSSSQTVFRSGLLKVDFDVMGTANIRTVRLEAVQGGSITTLGTWEGGSDRRALINLQDFPNLRAGNYEMRAIATDTTGQTFISPIQSLQILDWTQIQGDFKSNRWTLDPAQDPTQASTNPVGAIYLGLGGTDILNLGLDRSQILSLNGSPLNLYNPTEIRTQAIFGGSAFDHVVLADRRELYFQGIELLQFSDGTTLQLSVQPNDPEFSDQWNLQVTDVPSAWRFTQGDSAIMLASLDTGILAPVGSGRGIYDLAIDRLITDPTDDDNYGGSGHGHQAISVMSATANNAIGIAGVNWKSDVYVTDIYRGVTFYTAIVDAIAYARSNQKRIVFQGGVQGEFWLTHGGTQAQLEALMTANEDISVFAIAAGNGNVNVQDRTTQPTLSSGVARLQNTHENVLAVGALTYSGPTVPVNRLSNPEAIARANYSNYGEGITLMAPTDSWAIDAYGMRSSFSGTSCANPNMAGIASLVWSANPTLTGPQLRKILIDTAMDLGPVGRDANFGNGLVNADAAVRRAVAIARNYDVAMTPAILLKS